MANSGRWVYTPACGKRICRRLTIAERVRRWYLTRKRDRAHDRWLDLYMVTGYYPPVYPRR